MKQQKTPVQKLPKNKAIPPHFFNASTINVAKELLGHELIYNGPAGPVGGIITETEAYTQDDPACHAFNGNKTPRNAPMFLAAGHIYIYFIYGMYHCLNFVTEPEGTGCAVLIREVFPTIGHPIIQNNRPNIKKKSQLLNGHGKLMLGLGLPSTLNGTSLFDKHSPLQLDKKETPISIEQHPRIGLSKGQDKLWRFRYQIKNS